MSAYNPASLRVREIAPGTKDYTGVQTLVTPVGGFRNLGHGAVLLNMELSPTVGGGSVPFAMTQDGGNPRIFTIAGTDNWVASSIRIFWNGQRQSPLTDFVVSGTGNRTITLDASVDITLGGYGVMEGEGVKA